MIRNFLQMSHIASCELFASAINKFQYGIASLKSGLFSNALTIAISGSI